MASFGLHLELLPLLSYHHPGPAWVVNRFVEALVELSCGDGDQRGHILWIERESWLLRVSRSWGQCLAHLRSVGIQSILGVGRILRFLEYDGNPSGVVSDQLPALIVFSLEPRPMGPHEHHHTIDQAYTDGYIQYHDERYITSVTSHLHLHQS
jgi:hypothetical protein